MKIVIVGHVDHGKSTLIGRLIFDTGSLPPERMEEVKKASKELGKEVEFAYLMDQLKEEREGGITIDTTQTFFKTQKRNYVIIDAPGHVEFIKNMITGASQAEAAVLLVDAKEGIQEQTRRHAYILNMLGLNQIIILMNKMDLVGYQKENFEQVKEELLKFLTSINIRYSYVIPISAKYGENVARNSKKMKWHKGPTVLGALDAFNPKPKATDKPLRFPVQDVYRIDSKRILVGRVESGMIRKGQQILVLPSNKETKIKSIKVFGRDKKEAGEGESIGVTLTQPLLVGRGEVICQKEDVPKVTNSFKANVFWMSKAPLKVGKKIRLRCATQEAECAVVKIERRINSSTLEVVEEDARVLKLNEVGEVVLKTDKSIIVENFNFIKELGRFVLERKTEVVAGGIIPETKYVFCLH